MGVPWNILAKTGKDFYCGHDAFFRKNESIRIGDNVYMGKNVHIAAPCVIRSDVMLASYVALVGGDHQYKTPSVPMNQSGRDVMEPITIEEDVWIGHGAIILSGVCIAQGSIVAAGSIVTKNVPPCEIWGGTPVKFIRSRFETESEKRSHIAYLSDLYDGSLGQESIQD